MFPYYLLVFIPLLFSIFSYRDEAKVFNKRFPLVLFFIIFIVLLSLRSVNCGVDLANYQNKFEQNTVISFKRLFDFSEIEPGYYIFSAICKSRVNNFQLFLCACALVSVVPIMFLYRKETNHNILTISLFLGVAPFTMFFSGLRQSIAIGIGVICYHYCKKNKIVPFLLFVLLAFLFHQSAVVLIFLYPLTHMKITKLWIFPIALVFAVCIAFNESIFSSLMKLNSRYESRYIISSTGSYTYIILLILFVIFSFIITADNDKDVIGFRNLLVLSLFLQCFAPINTVAMRLNYYFLIFIPIAIPKFIDNAKPNYKKLAQISIFIFSVFFIIWFFKECYLGENILHTVPYEAFWENK